MPTRSQLTLFDFVSGYPIGYTYFNYVTEMFLCGSPPSPATCEAPISAGGHRYVPWRLLRHKHGNITPANVDKVVYPWSRA